VPTSESLRWNAAAARLSSFFNELAESFVEREDVVQQIILALLCREHVLLTGPPGTAKSQLASAVFSRVVDEHTGKPSFYARQFTESTVQTDLVGPIDFKTLMETGRTEHFTDEGILGAVHAFLDEVFDGRDNLLRGALNVLQERELKQGTRVTRGQIECALMTTNRYISDVLESSRETLLAFVDRIAFVGFVPRAFAAEDNLATVLRRHVGRAHRMPLTAPLSIQDLDVLQAATDAVEVPDEICDSLAHLLALLDAELNAAVRADPTFVPTRYLSTRTAVRSGRVLRALCVYLKIFHDPERKLVARTEDLAGLRLHLLLCGPAPDEAAKLLKRETDTHERRQLGIIKTEREIFERCWNKLLSHAKPAKSSRKAKRKRGEEATIAEESPRLTQDTASRVAAIQIELDAALGRDDVRAAVEGLRAMALLARGGQAGAVSADRALRDGVARLSSRALTSVLAAGDDPRRGARQVAASVAELASRVDGGLRETTALARWLRGRALAMVDEAVTHAPGATVTDLEAAAGMARGEATPRMDQRLDELEALAQLRQRLLAEGAAHGERADSDAAWARAVVWVEDELVVLWDESFRSSVAHALRSVPADRIGEVLSRLTPEFERLDRMAARISELSGHPSTLKSRVVGPRIGSLVGAIVARLETRDRRVFLERIDELLAVLGRAELQRAIPARMWLSWTASALQRSEAVAPIPEVVPDLDGYRKLRDAELRVPNVYTLAEVALRVAPVHGDGDGMARLATVLAEIPEPQRTNVVRGDLGRIERAVKHLETWWQALAGGGSFQPPEDRLEVLVRSRFYRVLLDESAPERFALEAKLIAELFPDQLESANALRGRIDALLARARDVAFDLLRRRSDAAWSATLGRTGDAGE
jgi:MoxR-like ATPase